MTVSRVANSDTLEVTTPSDREIRITRLFDAPPEMVFAAMHEPMHLRRWWGCLDEGFSMPVCDVDLRPGGVWRFVHSTPDGDFAFYGMYREVQAPERVVYTEMFDPAPDMTRLLATPAAEWVVSSPEGESTVTSTYRTERGGTRLTMDCLYPSVEVRDMVLGTGMESGTAISYDRLEELLKELGG